ncbi:MAG: hypothetical protein ACI307_00500 [Sodaliphilus sp.]
MKKLLLLAAVAMAFGASAQTLTQDWKHAVAVASADARQGVGTNGKVYVHVKTTGDVAGHVLVYDQNGLQNQTLPGGGNCAITIDQAGHLVVSDATFPNGWGENTVVKVYDPATPDQITNITTPAGVLCGRIDFLGKAEGDLTGDGALYYVGSTGTGLAKHVVVGGEASVDDSYQAIMDAGFAANNFTVVNPFMENDEMKYLYVARNAAPRIMVPEGDNFVTEQVLTLPNKGACNGAEIFILGGEKYIVYPTLPNYLDGFAISKIGKEGIVLVHEQASTVAANPNGTQANWLNAEVVDGNTANIYQYVPGAYCAKYTFSLPQSPTGISDVTAKKAEVKKVIENGQIYIINGDAKYNVMGAQVK